MISARPQWLIVPLALLVGLDLGVFVEAQTRREARDEAARDQDVATENVEGSDAPPGEEPRTGPMLDLSTERVVKSDAEWRRQLTPMQYYVTRMKGTEAPFSGRYASGRRSRGIFVCVCCEAPLFSSQHKYNSGTGWPSFWRPVDKSVLNTAWDYHGAYPRLEVVCRRCDAHLGHVFNDGPPPTGLRFCINSVALKLVPFPPPRRTEPDTTTDEADEAQPSEDGDAPSESGAAPDPPEVAPAPPDAEAKTAPTPRLRTRR